HFLGSKSEISTEEFGKFLGRKSDKLAFIVHFPCPETDLRRIIQQGQWKNTQAVIMRQPQGT
ncbi:hypothetical protein, partial [Porphyromonas uenonis]|uniref:hypothetical protein n=1 Tax=Porphyromonas uenonis TaxID=281920 RepID=UPI0005605C31